MGIRERRKREHINREKIILQSAKKLFFKNGFFAVTVEKIAEISEIGKGTVYSHFKSKEEIYARVFEEGLSTLLQYLKEAADICDGKSLSIKKCLDAYIQFYRMNKEYFDILLFIDTVGNPIKIPTEILKRVRTKKEEALNILKNAIKNDIDNGQFHKDIDLKQTAYLLWGTINGVLHLVESRLIKENELMSILDRGLQIVLRGLQENDL